MTPQRIVTAVAALAALFALAACRDDPGGITEPWPGTETAAAPTPAQLVTTTDREAAFLAWLDEQHVRYGNPDDAVLSGWAACHGQATGETVMQLIDRLGVVYGYTPVEATDVIGGAESLLCRADEAGA